MKEAEWTYTCDRCTDASHESGFLATVTVYNSKTAYVAASERLPVHSIDLCDPCLRLFGDMFVNWRERGAHRELRKGLG